MDTEKKCRSNKNDPLFSTKFIFPRLIETISHTLSMNPVIQVLILEGLPINTTCVQQIAKVSVHEYFFLRVSIVFT